MRTPWSGCRSIQDATGHPARGHQRTRYASPLTFRAALHGPGKTRSGHTCGAPTVPTIGERLFERCQDTPTRSIVRRCRVKTSVLQVTGWLAPVEPDSVPRVRVP